jgi:plastocyanin
LKAAALARILFLAILATMAAPPFISSGQLITVTAKAPLPDVVVWLTRRGEPEVEVHPQRARLVQKHKMVSPHLLVLPVGSEVEFPNQDPFFHNVFSLYEGKRFDLGLYEAGTTRTVVFNRSGISYIFCNIHAEMSAVIVALKTRYYGISDRKGVITILDVPPGQYDMNVWHERVLPETLARLGRTVQISTASSSLGFLNVSEERNISETHKNKYGEEYDRSSHEPAYVGK